MSSNDDEAKKNDHKLSSTNPMRDNDQDEHTRPGIAPPGGQPDQQQIPFAPPQRSPGDGGPARSSNRWIPPTTGNPDLDPAGLGTSRSGPPGGLGNPLTPQGMIYDPGQLLDMQRAGRYPDSAVPPGARFDPFGPPDPSLVGPGRGPMPSSSFGDPDPDHFVPPGQPQPPNLGARKSLKFPWPPGSGRGPNGPGGFPPFGGAGGSPFL